LKRFHIVQNIRQLGADVRLFVLKAQINVPVVLAVAFGDGQYPNSHPRPSASPRSPRQFDHTPAAADSIHVVRALGPNLQQIHFGHQLARTNNPRLQQFLTSSPNSDVTPLS
jgi:hypothetical protein